MTFDPGVYDASEAPWFEFNCEGCTTVVKQWMNEAAEVFGQQIANRSAGGEATVELQFMSLDGMWGQYVCHMELNHAVDFMVYRGNVVELPNVEEHPA